MNIGLSPSSIFSTQARADAATGKLSKRSLAMMNVSLIGKGSRTEDHPLCFAGTTAVAKATTAWP